MDPDRTNLHLTIQKMVQDAQQLLGSVLEKAGPAYARARRAKSEWAERHPLLVLIEAARESLRMLPGSIREPWLLAQLSAYLEVVRKWKEDPSWKGIEPCLVNASDFSHVISMLMLAERLKAWGNNVQLIANAQNATADLRVQAVGGRQEWLQIECYQPRQLSGSPIGLSNADAYKITKRAMEKARRQLGNENPGILALCMYNQPRSNIDPLKKVIQARLRETSRDSLAGFILICQNNIQTSHEGTLSFSSGITMDFLQNPAYFGSINISSDAPQDPPGSLIGSEIKEPLKEIIVKDFVILQRVVQQASEDQPIESSMIEETPFVPTKMENLPTLNGPIRDRAIFTWSGDKYSAFFEGEGNIDFQCANCGCVLARTIWRLSCSNMVLQCPRCRVYNEFPPQESSLLSKTNKIAIEAGDSPYRCSTTVVMKRGLCLIGVKRDYHLHH